MDQTDDNRRPVIMPLGDEGLLVRFATALSEPANLAAVRFARRLRQGLPAGVTEIDPNLVSVLLKYDPDRIDFDRLAGGVRLLLSAPAEEQVFVPANHSIAIDFGGESGPDLEAVAAALGIGVDGFIAAHNAVPLRVLTTGFAPGFVYCGFHPEALRLPRRASIRPPVRPGSVLFAAGQTAINSTPVPTGWHVIGHTDFRNFDPAASPPTRLEEGDIVHFSVAVR